MSEAEKKLAEILGNGGKPTSADLESALAAVLEERNALARMASDMGSWLSQLVIANVRNDGAAVADILNAFMQAHVQVVHGSAKVH